MTYTENEIAVLKALVEQELKEVREEGKGLQIVNSPFLSTISRTKSKDIEFLKTETLYIEFLEELSKKF